MPPDTDFTARRIALALCLVAIIWSVAIWLAPLALGVDPVMFGGAASIPYALGALVCHQRPERSFVVGTIPWAVCARCSGLYLSAAAGVALVPWVRTIHMADAGTLRRWRVALGCAALPSVTSWFLEACGAWVPDNASRALLAVPFGLAIGVLLASMSRRAAPGGSEA